MEDSVRKLRVLLKSQKDADAVITAAKSIIPWARISCCEGPKGIEVTFEGSADPGQRQRFHDEELDDVYAHVRSLEGELLEMTSF
jgi:hypothetical protein